jgi:tetratricopeptide (TPR) repeat protein
LDSTQNHELELKRIRLNYEKLLPSLFNFFFLSLTINESLNRLFDNIVVKEYQGLIEKTLIISALTLNSVRAFDESKIMLLMDALNSSSVEVQQRALVGLVFVLTIHNDLLPYFPKLMNRLKLLTDEVWVLKSIQQIIIRIIATAETESISQKLKEEILPEMIKISPYLVDKYKNNGESLHDESDEDALAWEEMLDKSGVKDKLKELTDLQQEGADVYLSTFAMLKNFSFFSELSNWFMTFNSNHSAVVDLFQSSNNALVNAFVNNNYMCNSDKYSFCFTILQMPESGRSNLLNSFTSEAQQLEEQSKDEVLLRPDVVNKSISNLYIQDLYRFYKLYPHNSDFVNLFDHSLSLHKSHLFRLVSDSYNFKSTVADYYFLKNHFPQSVELLQEIQEENKIDAILYQKLGYSFQQLGDVKNALESYQRSDMIAPDDYWTVRKIGYCYKYLGDYKNALVNFQHANFLKPNQKSILFQIAHCLGALYQYEESLKMYYKLEAEYGEELKVWRPIAYFSLCISNIAKADYYIGKILMSEPNATDYMLAAHVAWSQKRMNHALDFYSQSLKLYEGDNDLFVRDFKANTSILRSLGITEDEEALMLDVLKL